MIHHCAYFKLKPGFNSETLESLLIETRIHLLKIPEVFNLKTGKNTEAKSEWQFFYAFDCENLAKLDASRHHPVHVKFLHDILQPHISQKFIENFEMDPGKDIRYS